MRTKHLIFVVIALVVLLVIATIKFVILQPVPVIRLDGIVIDENEQPLAGAPITFRIERRYPLPRRVIDYAPAQTIISGSDGRFSIDGRGVYLQVLNVRAGDRWWLMDYGDQQPVSKEEMTTFTAIYTNLPETRYVSSVENPAIFPVVPLDFKGEIKITRGGQDVWSDGTVVTHKPDYPILPSIGPRFKAHRALMLDWDRKVKPYDPKAIRQLRDDMIAARSAPATLPE